jgi:protein TonB
MATLRAARASRQPLIFLAIAGLHGAAFLLVASGLADHVRLPAPSPPPAWVLPKPAPPEPVLRPEPPEPAGYVPDREPLPTVQIPLIRDPAPAPDVVVRVPVGLDAGSDPDSADVDVETPGLRTPAGRLAAQVEACYPSASRRLGEEGRAVARVVIDAGGRVQAWSLEQSTGFPRLDAAADCVLRRLEFLPGRRDGRAIEAAVRLPIAFRLN